MNKLDWMFAEAEAKAIGSVEKKELPSALDRYERLVQLAAEQKRQERLAKVRVWKEVSL